LDIPEHFLSSPMGSLCQFIGLEVLMSSKRHQEATLLNHAFSFWSKRSRNTVARLSGPRTFFQSVIALSSLFHLIGRISVNGVLEKSTYLWSAPIRAQVAAVWLSNEPGTATTAGHLWTVQSARLGTPSPYQGQWLDLYSIIGRCLVLVPRFCDSPCHRLELHFG